MERRHRWQAAFAFVLAALLLVLPGAEAQEAQSTAAQTAAREWLKLTDAGDAKASWEQAAPLFQNAMNTETWSDALQRSRGSLGATQRRTVVSTEFSKGFPGVPEGEYALVQFGSVFEKQPAAHETVTLQGDAGGRWRVVGYFIR